MVQRDPASVEAQDEAGDSVADIALAASAAVLGIIADGLADVTPDTLPVDVAISANAAEAKAAKAIKEANAKAKASARRSIISMADGNDDWAKPMFDAKGIKQSRYVENAITKAIVMQGIQAVEIAIDAIMDTSAVGIVQGGRLMSTKEAYTYALQDAVAASKAGVEAYTASVQRTVKNLSESGLRVVTGTNPKLPMVQFSSGRTQEVYSVVRSSVMSGYRETLQAMRNQQGREFGADGVEVSAHALCAPDHAEFQGNQYPKREFDDIQQGLERPIEIGKNCHHVTYPILYGISQRTYSDEDLADMLRSSEETVTFDGLSGKRMAMTRYEASQYQRGVEANARKYATRADLQTKAGVSASESRKMYQKTIESYDRICKEAGLNRRKDRMLSSFDLIKM